MSDAETGVPLYDGDIAPGDEPASDAEIAVGIRGYLIGLGLAVLAICVGVGLLIGARVVARADEGEHAGSRQP